ncbi:MAG TPA: phospholipase D family protein [Alphaproteobacteria bacterium]|nr:phospholipase D family protein [Alphaproteobacteria bacterium]
MEVSFSLQDPTDPATTYLYEAIIAAVEGSTRWRGMYAFASRNGVDNLLSDTAMEGFLHAGGVAELIVGIDAITNRATLERLQHFEGKHPSFKPRVFWNAFKGLFHPKLSLFDYADGRQTLIVGSGNLTPGGFRTNFEGYTVVRTDPGESVDLASLNAFMTRHAASIRSIDNTALLEAAKNIIKVSKKTPAVPPPLVIPAPTPAAAMITVTGRVLVAQVPAAGGRWQQLHLNAAVMAEFFHVSDHKNQRVFLTPVDSTGNPSDEEARQVVFSERNRNYKIEISQGRGKTYPTGTPPVIVFYERQLRTFDYMLVMPGDAGYRELIALSTSQPTVGRGHPRVIVNAAALQAAWPAAPLLTRSIAPEPEAL